MTHTRITMRTYDENSTNSQWITGPMHAPEVPDFPVIPVITGDGIGVDITPAMIAVVDAAVNKAYGSSKGIVWWQVEAGQSAYTKVGSYLPEATLNAIRKARVAIKGPLTTPVGEGFRSVNVQLRQTL